jgi:LAO/AO transport system kinase
MTDLFCLLQLPNAGDDLQAIKKGVMELADLVVINKADLDEAAATRARAQISSALRLFGLHGNPDHLHHDDTVWHPQVLQMSALNGVGVDAFWAAVTQLSRPADGQRPAGRAPPPAGPGLDVGTHRSRPCASDSKPTPACSEALPGLTDDVRAGRVAPSVAARRLLDLMN